jgi:hypothetical protein
VIWSGETEGGATAPAGVYFYRLRTPGFVQTRKMIKAE